MWAFMQIYKNIYAEKNLKITYETCIWIKFDIFKYKTGLLQH